MEVKNMNLKVHGSIVLWVLLLSAIFAATMITTASFATWAKSNPTGHNGSETSLMLTYTGDTVDGACIPCGGDPVGGGGHP
jgi:archaellin